MVSRILMKLGVTTVQTLSPTSVLGAIMSSPQEHRQSRAETSSAKRMGAFLRKNHAALTTGPLSNTQFQRSLGSNRVFTLHEPTRIRPRGHMVEVEVVRDRPKERNARPQHDRHARNDQALDEARR